MGLPDLVVHENRNGGHTAHVKQVGWIALLLLYGAALAAWGVREASPCRLAQGLFALGLLAAVLCFGIVNEARVLLIFVPFLVFSLAEYATAIARSLRDGRAG